MSVATEAVCMCCGRRWLATSRGYDPENRRCKARAGCVARALGPTPAKNEAKRLRRSRTRFDGAA